jgi:hypothetical protein
MYNDIPLVLDSDDTTVTELVGLARLGHGAQGGAAHVEMGWLAGVEIAGAQVGDDDGHRLARAGLVTRAHNLRTRIHEQISSGPADRDEHFAP